MNIEDIFIGDWVYILNFPEVGKKTPVKIVGMDTNHNAVEYVHNGIRLWSAVVRLEPIPLTAEILKKTFPRPTDGLAWFPDEGVFNCHTLHEGEINAFGLFRYVHQLQLALRLCEIEKQITL